ncbi:zeta toxin family protein [Sphingomonas sp. PsM26]|nr:zeta toxin family protein [Sphingomonas sp. PsM26]
MADDAIKGLTPDEQKATAARFIEQDLQRSQPVENPRAIITGGQPGSGKSYVVESVGVQFEGMGGVIVIDPDVIRPKLPYMKDLIAAGSLDIPDAAYIDAGTIAHEMVQIAKQERRNVIVDGTLANTDRAIQLAEGFQKAAYQVEFHGVAVSPELSHARTYSRREDQIAKSDTGFGRGVGDDFHFGAVKGYVSSVEALQTKSVVSSMALYYPNGSRIETKLEGGQWVPAVSMKEKLEQAHAQPAPEILKAAVQTWDVASNAMRAREAPRDEQAKVDGFRAAVSAKAPAPTPAEQADRFDAAVAAECKGIVKRANRLESQLQERLERTQQARTETIAAKPSGPKWMPGAAKALATWDAQQRVQFQAVADTISRIDRVAPYTLAQIPGYPSKVEEMAVRKVERREPQMAKEAMAFRATERQQQARAFSEARSQQQAAGQKLSR